MGSAGHQSWLIPMAGQLQVSRGVSCGLQVASYQRVSGVGKQAHRLPRSSGWNGGRR